MKNFVKYLKSNLIAIAIGAGISLCLIALYIFVWKGTAIINFSDAFCVMGAVFLFVSMLMFVGSLGFFDFASYGAKQFALFFSPKNARKMPGYKDYCDEKALSRKESHNSYIGFALLGVLYIIISGIIVLCM